MTGIFLIQLSDMHLAATAGGEDVTQGQHPNDPEVTLGLANFYRRLPAMLRRLNIDPKIRVYTLVTGDLTVRGSRGEFDAAQQYLDGGRYQVREGEFSGLSLGGRRTLIPGNHDHWGGRRPWFVLLPAYNHDLHNHEIEIHSHISDAPHQPRCLPSRDGKFRVELLGLDSCSGFASSKTNIRPRQGGRLNPDQIGWVRNWELPEEDSQCVGSAVRVVAVHHDLDFQATPWRMSRAGLSKIPYARVTVFPWPLRKGCRQALVAAADHSRVAGILTGHQHSPWFRTFPGQQPREFRASTTLGSEEVEAGLVGFYLHHIAPSEGRKAAWRTYGASWDPEGDSGGFDLCSQPLYAFEIPILDGKGG